MQFFGAGPTVSSITWIYIHSTDAIPKHLLWALLLLKVYATKFVHEALNSVHGETFRRWAWLIIEALSALPRYVNISTNWDGELRNVGNLTVYSS